MLDCVVSIKLHPLYIFATGSEMSVSWNAYTSNIADIDLVYKACVCPCGRMHSLLICACLRLDSVCTFTVGILYRWDPNSKIRILNMA